MGKELHYVQEHSRKKEKKKRKLKPISAMRPFKLVGMDNSKKKLTCLSLHRLLHEVGKSIFYKEYGSRNLCKRNYCQA